MIAFNILHFVFVEHPWLLVPALALTLYILYKLDPPDRPLS